MALYVFLIGEGVQYHEELASCLNENGFKVRIVERWADFAAASSESREGPNALYFDLDSDPVGIGELRRFKKKHPDVHLLAAASRSYNPDMAECIEKHIFALLKKPVDLEELLYLLGGISKLRRNQ